jgi:hypothetical protein
MGWMANAMPWPLYPAERDAVPILQEAIWAPLPVWTSAGNLAVTGIWSADRDDTPTTQSRHKHTYINTYTQKDVTKAIRDFRPTSLRTVKGSVNPVGRSSNRDFIVLQSEGQDRLFHVIKSCTQFLDASAKLRKSAASFVMPIRPSAWNNSSPTGRIFVEFYILVGREKSVEKIQAWLNSNIYISGNSRRPS